MLDDISLNQNPYESPETEADRPASRSSMVYWVLSLSMLVFWAIMIGLLFRFAIVHVQDGGFWIRFPGEFVTTSTSGDPTIYGDVTFYTTRLSGLFLLSISVVASLAIVNGSVLLWRRQRY